MDLDFVSVHKQAKKEFGQYPAILTSHLVNNPYVLLLPVKAIYKLFPVLEETGPQETDYWLILEHKILITHFLKFKQ